MNYSFSTFLNALFVVQDEESFGVRNIWNLDVCVSVGCTKYFLSTSVDSLQVSIVYRVSDFFTLTFKTAGPLRFQNTDGKAVQKKWVLLPLNDSGDRFQVRNMVEFVDLVGHFKEMALKLARGYKQIHYTLFGSCCLVAPCHSRQASLNECARLIACSFLLWQWQRILVSHPPKL